MVSVWNLDSHSWAESPARLAPSFVTFRSCPEEIGISVPERTFQQLTLHRSLHWPGICNRYRPAPPPCPQNEDVSITNLSPLLPGGISPPPSRVGGSLRRLVGSEGGSTTNIRFQHRQAPPHFSCEGVPPDWVDGRGFECHGAEVSRCGPVLVVVVGVAVCWWLWAMGLQVTDWRGR